MSKLAQHADGHTIAGNPDPKPSTLSPVAEIDDDQSCEVTHSRSAETLLTHRIDNLGHIHYLVQWRPSWEQAMDIPYFDGLLTRYCERSASRALRCGRRV